MKVSICHPAMCPFIHLCTIINALTAFITLVTLCRWHNRTVRREGWKEVQVCV